MMAVDAKVCARCQKPVQLNESNYELFEHMHWLCFHLDFEHDGDPDAPCSDPSCPWWKIEVFNDRLRALGEDPQTVLQEAVDLRAAVTRSMSTAKKI